MFWTLIGVFMFNNRIDDPLSSLCTQIRINGPHDLKGLVTALQIMQTNAAQKPVRFLVRAEVITGRQCMHCKSTKNRSIFLYQAVAPDGGRLVDSSWLSMRDNPEPHQSPCQLMLLSYYAD